MTQTADWFFLDLTGPLSSQSELFADFFQSHFLCIDTEKRFDNVSFPFCQCRQSTFYFRR